MVLNQNNCTMNANLYGVLQCGGGIRHSQAIEP